MRDELITLYGVLKASLAEHASLCAAASPDVGALANARWRVAQAGRRRTEHLTSIVYPKLDDLSNVPGRRAYLDLKASSAGYQTQISTYVARWPTEQIVANWRAYQTASTDFRKGVLRRIVVEESTLLPMILRCEMGAMPSRGLSGK